MAAAIPSMTGWTADRTALSVSNAGMSSGSTMLYKERSVSTPWSTIWPNLPKGVPLMRSIIPWNFPPSCVAASMACRIISKETFPSLISSRSRDTDLPVMRLMSMSGL